MSNIKECEHDKEGNPICTHCKHVCDGDCLIIGGEFGDQSVVGTYMLCTCTHWYLVSLPKE